MGINYPATSPNLLASFLRICPNESLTTTTKATSQAYYVIRGSGNSISGNVSIDWNKGDLFLFPASSESVIHTASEDTAIYAVNDTPLLTYLGVKPTENKYKATLFKKETIAIRFVSNSD